MRISGKHAVAIAEMIETPLLRKMPTALPQDDDESCSLNEAEELIAAGRGGRVFVEVDEALLVAVVMKAQRAIGGGKQLIERAEQLREAMLSERAMSIRDTAGTLLGALVVSTSNLGVDCLPNQRMDQLREAAVSNAFDLEELIASRLLKESE